VTRLAALPGRPGRRLLLRLLAVVLLAVVSMPFVSARASASCAEPLDLETGFAEAEVVFIGVVVELSNHDRTAVMEVEEVWKGSELPEVVTVRGGPDDPDVFSSVDRTFERGTYVVFPLNSDTPFEDNNCTLTQRTSSALDVINPNAAEPPEDPNPPEPVTTTIAATGGGAPVGNGTEVVGDAAADAEKSEQVSDVPWVLMAGTAVVLLGAGAYVVAQHRSR